MKYMQKYVYFKKKYTKPKNLHFRLRPQLALRIKLIVSPTPEAPEAAVQRERERRGTHTRLVKRDARLPPSLWLPTTPIGHSQSKQQGNGFALSFIYFN